MMEFEREENNKPVRYKLNLFKKHSKPNMFIALNKMQKIPKGYKINRKQAGNVIVKKTKNGPKKKEQYKKVNRAFHSSYIL